MSWGYIAQQIVNGLILGSMYALVAIGFSMIYGIIRLINFAHGDVVMIGAFLTLGLLQVLHAPFPVVACGVLLAGAAVGILIERGAFRPMRGAPQVTGFIASLAVSIMLQNLGILFLTAQPRNFTFPDYLQKLIQAGPVSFRTIDVVIMVSAILLMAGLMLMVNKTRLGMAMRATAENIDVARLMGININRTILAAFAGLCPGAEILCGGGHRRGGVDSGGHPGRVYPWACRGSLRGAAAAHLLGFPGRTGFLHADFHPVDYAQRIAG